MLSELRFGVKKYNVRDYRISHFTKTCISNTFPIMVKFYVNSTLKYAVNYIPGTKNSRAKQFFLAYVILKC